jgi:hypothetical protein
MNRHPSTRRPVARTAILLAGSALALLAPLSPASAGDDRVERSGSCSAGARWDLKVKSDDGRLEVEGEVDSNQSGQTWRWRFRHNGSFSVERRLVDLQGTDKIVFRARHDGETCRGVVNF